MKYKDEPFTFPFRITTEQLRYIDRQCKVLKMTRFTFIQHLIDTHQQENEIK